MGPKLDFAGNPVEVGDVIFYYTTGRYPEARLVRISRMSEKTLFGHIIKTNRPDLPEKEVSIRNSFVKVENYDDS